MSNILYWKDKSGDIYRQQQLMRRNGSSDSYEQQEFWLRTLFSQLSESTDKPIVRFLDYGCGFGRIANIAAEFDAIEYFGFDISNSMTAPLLADPPARLKGNITERVRVGECFDTTYPVDEKFHVILTVSVLIHNEPAAAREIILAMLGRLAPGGIIVLIENPHTAVSAPENFWHGGCWCHSFVRYMDGRADCEIIDNFAGRHAIYVARATADALGSRYLYRAGPEHPAERLELQGVLLKGLDRAAFNADHLIAEWSANGQSPAELVGRVHDLDEQVARKADLEQHLALEAAKLRDELLLARARFSERQQLLEDLGWAVTATKARFEAGQKPRGDIAKSKGEPSNLPEWNAPQDTHYSHLLPAFEKVLHIFHKEWFGIRAAAGSLPGAKLAIPADVNLSPERILEIYDKVVRDGYQRLVFHGISWNATKLIEFFAKRGLAEIVYAVVHGAPAQWDSDPERRTAFALIELLKASLVRRVHFMKKGFRYPTDGLFQPILFNMSPKFSAEVGYRRRVHLYEGVAFAPSWAILRKNLYTNVLAAAMSERVRHVWVYANGIELPPPLSRKLRPKIHSTRESTFELMAQASLCLNVSLVDCHPMVNIESQTIGRPCLRGDLHLDALEDHPYITLTNVCDPTSVAEILDKIERVLTVPPAEMEAMTLDYQAQSDEVACSRYLEFLEL